jgi:hypothetical protein
LPGIDALEVVAAADDIKPLAQRYLGKWRVVPSMKEAVEGLRKSNFRVNFVTLAGEKVAHRSQWILSK